MSSPRTTLARCIASTMALLAGGVVALACAAPPPAPPSPPPPAGPQPLPAPSQACERGSVMAQQIPQRPDLQRCSADTDCVSVSVTGCCTVGVWAVRADSAQCIQTMDGAAVCARACTEDDQRKMEAARRPAAVRCVSGLCALAR